MIKPFPHRDLTVQAVLDAWPATARVFIARRMACVGCDMAPFMTVAEAAASYGIPADALEAELCNAAQHANAAAEQADHHRPSIDSIRNAESEQ